ncbi:hypothetical protein IKL64_08480 [bacterium]|nr:hypothetical protein [bacterium]
MADINNVGKFGKNSGVDLNSIKGGLKKDALKTEEQKSIFEAVDADKNGVLDDNEVKSFKEKLDSSQDGVISKSEAKKFLKSLNLNEVDQKELLKFLLDYSLNTEDVQEVRIKEENGKKLVEVVYKNGMTEIVNHDKSSVVTTQPDEDGNVTVSHYTPDKKLTKTSVTNAQGDVTDTEYLEDRETPATSVTTTKSGSVSTVTYDEGKPVAKQVKHGSVTSNYSYAEDGSEVLNSKIENEGVPTKERRTEYSYDENGVVTANITEFGKSTVQTIVDNNVVSETITEEGKTTVKTHNQDGTLTETVTTEAGTETTVYNSENKRLSKTKVVDGQEYTIQYDGQGNTVGIIVENGESPALIAKRFGCDVNELLELNKDQVKGKGKGRYFIVASEIKIPGEIEPDAKVLQDRQTKDEAVSAYKDTVAEIEAEKARKAAEEAAAAEEKASAEKAAQDLVTQKESAKSIYNELMSAIDGWNDDDAIYKALKKIDNPTEMAEVERLLQAKGYKSDNYYSAVEKFMYKELGDSKAYDKSFDEMESMVKKWISNGTLTGDNAVKAQARLAARLVIDGCDGAGTDVDEAKEGIRLIKAPKPTGNRAVDNAEAAKVYDEVNRIIKGHKSFGAGFKDLKDYLKGDLWGSEIKYLDGIMAQNNAIQGEQKAEAIHDLVEEAVSGGGTDIEYLKQAIMAIDSPEDRVALEANLKVYCNKKGIKPKIEGQDHLQAILYDECDTFLGVSTDHNEIRKFNEMLIEQGAYTEEEAQKLRAETAALQMLDGGLDDIQAAAGTIKDDATYAKLDALLKTKNFNGVEGFINKKFSSQVPRDKAMAIFASNNLLSDDKAAKVATRLLQNSDYDTKALGLMSIRNATIANAVNDALKQKGTSLESILKAFNEEKAECKLKAAVWDNFAPIGGFLGLGSIAEHISDEYRANTDMSNNLYLESDNPITLTKEQVAAYEMTVKTLEDGLAQMKADYQAALDSQGVVSGAVNEFCSVYNLGTTRDEIEARIEHEEETVRLLTLASHGKLTKIVDGKTVPVTFEEVFTERQSAIVSANGSSFETVSAVYNKNDVNFDVAKVEKVANKAQTIVAMDFAKDNIAVCWSELDRGLKTNSNKELSIAINDTLQKLSEMSGKEMNLSSYGYEIKDGIIVDKAGKPVSAAKLKEIANQLKQGLSDVSQALFGINIPANESYDDVVELLEDGYEDKMEAFKQEYRDAFGQEATDEMIENYISTINTGKMVVNIGAAIGAVIAAPFTGGGSLAVFAFATAASMGLNALEKSTDADGYTNTEWTSDAEQALWDGALAAVGYKVGIGADKLVTQGFEKGSNLAKMANSLMNKNKALLQKMAPKMSKEAVDKAAVWLSRAEATFGEISSDTVQSIVQSYCMEGELNMDSFVSGMIMSVAGNAAGHTFSAFGDVKVVKKQHKLRADVDNIISSGRSLESADVRVINDYIKHETDPAALAKLQDQLKSARSTKKGVTVDFDALDVAITKRIAQVGPEDISITKPVVTSVTPEVKPAEVEVDDAVVVKPTDGDVDDAVVIKPADGGVDDAVVVKPTDGDVDDAVVVKPTDGDVDDAVVIKPADGGADDAVVVKPTDGDVDDAVVIKPADGGVDDAVVVKPTDGGADDAVVVKPADDAIDGADEVNLIANGLDGTSKYTKAQINELLEKSQVPIPDDVLTELLDFPVTSGIDFEIKQQVIQQLKSPEDVQMLSSLMKLAKSEGVDINLAQIGTVIDRAKFSGNVTNPAEMFNKLNEVLASGKLKASEGLNLDKLLSLTDTITTDTHKQLFMTLLDAASKADHEMSFDSIENILMNCSDVSVATSFNKLVERYPDNVTFSVTGTDLFNLLERDSAYVMRPFNNISYESALGNFQKIIINDLVNSGASLDRIDDVMFGLSFNIHEMSSIADPQGIIDLIKKGESGQVINYIIHEGMPVSVVDLPAMNYIKASGIKFERDNFGDISALLQADLSTPQQIQAFNMMLQAKDLNIQPVEITNITSSIKTDADVARLQSMIDSGKIDAFQFIKDTKPAVTPDTPEVKPSTPEVAPETPKTPAQIRMDEIKRLKATYGLDVNQTQALVEMKINNPKRFAKIEDSGLLDLIRDGKIDAGILRRLENSPNMFFSNRTLAEIRRMANGEPLVPSIPKSEIEAISKHVPNGNVCEIDGALYVNDNGSPVRLKISKEAFEDLFPPLGNVAFCQGDIGDCWFVSTLENLLDKPSGRVSVYQLFEQQGDDILVRFPGSSDAVLFNKGELAYNGRDPSICTAEGFSDYSALAGIPKGAQMIEQAYAVHRLKEGARAYDATSSITDVSKLTSTDTLLKRLHAGTEKEALEDLLGATDIEVTRNKAKITQLIQDHANDPNFVLEFGTKSKPGFLIESELDANYDLYSSHAYAIKGYNPETGMVYISNPWSTHTITEVPMYELTKHLDNMTCVDLRTVQRAGASSSVDMTAIRSQIEGLEFVGSYDGEIRDELINNISIAVTQGAENNPKLIANRLEILKSGDMSLMSAIYANPQTATFKIDNHEALKEIKENLLDTFHWNTGFVIDAINADNIDRVQALSRRVKAGDTDAINEIHYVQYFANPHKVVYGDTTVDVDSKMILSLLSGFRLGDNKSFDSEISKLFSTAVDMREKKAYGKSLAGILEQKPELVDIVEKTKGMNITEYRAYVDKLIADGTIPENMSFKTFEPDPNEVEAATAIGAHIHKRKAEKYMGVDVSASSKGVSTGDQHEGILDIFKKKKPVTTTSIVEKLSPEFQNLRARLLSSEMPTTFDKAYFESWAKENGLTLQYESNGTVAKFVDDDGLVLRRITEDSTKPGMVYDDRVNVFDEKGALIGGKNTFSWDSRPLIYDVVDGHTTNMVTLDAAGNWVSKETGLKVNYNPITGMEAGMHGSVFGRVKKMFGGSRHSVPEGVPTDVPESISSRAKFQSGFTTETSGIASSVPSVSSKLRKAIDMEAAGKTLVTQLDSNVDPSSISRYVKDGEVCAIGDTLYVNDNGAPVQLKLSKEKFEELFPPVGCATAEQSAHHTCWLVSQMNAMMDSSGGRVQLYSMLEQDGNDILVHLKNRKLPIRFENGQPLRGYSELQMGENAAPGLDMIYQSVLSERMNAMGGVAQRDVTNIKDFDIIEMTNYSGRMQGTTLGHRALVNGKSQISQINHPNMLAGEEQIMAALEKFKPGEDMFTVTYGAHHRHVVDYNPETKMVTFHDPYNGGVDRSCPVSDLLNQYQLTAQYYPRNELTAGVADVSPTPVKPAVTTPSGVSVKPQTVKPTTFEQKSTVIMGSWRDVATTADGLPIKAKIQGDVVIISKNGKETEIPIAKGEEIPIHETSTDSFLIIKREGFRTTITTSKTPELDVATPARPTAVEASTVQPQSVTPPSKPQTKVLSSGVESEIGTINGRPLKAKYVSLSADRVATVEINGKAYNISAGSSLDVANGVTLKCDKFGRVTVTNNQGVSVQSSPRTATMQDVASNDYQASARQREVFTGEPKGHMSAAPTSVSGSVLSQSDMDAIANMRNLDEDMKSVVAVALNDFGVRMSKGQMPSREMMQQVTAELSAKYGVDQTELTRDIESVMSKLDDWKDFAKYNFRYTEKRNIEFGLDQEVMSFRIKKGLVPENQLNASNDILAELETRITNGEIPSSEMMSSVAQNIATKYGTTVDEVMPLINGTISSTKIKRFAKYFEKPLDKNLKAMQDGYAPIDREIGNLRESKGLPRETDAQLKAQEDARLQAEAELKARQEAEAQAKQERQAILDAYQDVYPEISEAGFRDDDAAVKLILLMEDYDATNITYQNFDQQALYGKIYGAGITNDADMDIAFKIVKERFHADVIADEVRIKDLKAKYHFKDIESIQDSDNVIAILKERMANGQSLTNSDLENILADNWHNQFDLDAIKQRVLDEPELQQYLNENLHLDILSNKKYLENSTPERLEQVGEVLNKLRARVRAGEELTLDMVNAELDALHETLSANGSFVSTDQYWALQDILRNDPELAPLSKDFVEDIIQGGYEPEFDYTNSANPNMDDAADSNWSSYREFDAAVDEAFKDVNFADSTPKEKLDQIKAVTKENLQNAKPEDIVNSQTLAELFAEIDNELRTQGVFLSQQEQVMLMDMLKNMVATLS